MKQLTIHSKTAINRIISLFLVISIFMSNSNILLRTAVMSIAAGETKEAEITINQEITKYIPYSYSDEDKGVIIQQKLSITKPENTVMQESKYVITIPTYAEIAPSTIEIVTKTATITEDNTQNIYYKKNEGVLTIFQKEQINEEYYITYYYPLDAYTKYLESTHVNEYPDGEIVKIEKDEETGEVWAYIDFAWDPDENEGEMPENKHLVDKTPIQINTQIELSNEEETITKSSTLTQELDIAIGGEITSEMQTSITEMSKAKIYTKKAINFETENQINITRSDVFTTLKIENKNSTFVLKDDTSKTAKVQYNFITISKTNFENILEQDGNINILDSTLQVISTINSSTEVDENGNYVFIYPEATNQITLEITGIANNGILTIKQSRTLIAEQEYNKNEMTEFKALRISEAIATKNNEITQTIEQIVEISLTETITTANLNINNSNLSTNNENTGIEFTVELKNNNENSDLWANPFIIIEMPTEVAEIKINNAKMLYGDTLQIISSQVIDLNGNKAILIKISGTQQDFISSTIVGGTTIVLNTNIKLKELTPTQQNNEVKLYYFNENKTNYENTTIVQLEEEYTCGINNTQINYIAPVEFNTIQKMTGFDNEGTIISSINAEKQEGKIEILTQAKKVTNTITLMNNTGNETTTIKTIGRIPHIGAKNIITGEELGNTINLKLISKINFLEGAQKEYTVYYTTNGEADTNLENAQNGWTAEPQNLEEIKSYMIVVNSISQGEKLVFEYTTQIPKMLEHGEYTYSTVATYYTNNTEVGSVEEIAETNIIGLTTGIGARANIEISAGIDEGANLTEGQKVKYKIKVENTGRIPAENVVIRNPIPEGTTYIEETVVNNDIGTFDKYTYYSSSNELKWEIGKIEEGQEVELQYNVVVDNIPSILEYYGTQEGFTEKDGKFYIIKKDEQTGNEIITEITELPTIVITNSASLQADNIEKEVKSNETYNQVVKSYFNILEESSKAKAVYLEEGENYKYTVIVENKTELQIKNVNISKVIPEGISYKSSEISQGSGKISFDQTNNKLTAAFPVLEAYEVIELEIDVVTNKLQGDIYKKEIITNSIISADGLETNTSSSVSNTIAKPKITAKLESNIKQRYVYEKDIIMYNISITNENDANISNLCINNIIPEGTKFISGIYTKHGQEYQILSDGTKQVKVETSLEQGTITVQIKVQVENITSDIEELDIINKAILSANNVEEFEIGQIKHTVINTGNNNGGENGDSSEDGANGGSGEKGEDGKIRYKIKGTIWEDSNKDGERQDSEELIKGISVYLIKENGEIVKDYKTGEEKSTITDLDGDYEFNNVEPGKYMVVFIYDNNEYEITEYQKYNIINDRNSDAILKIINFNGQEREAGVTDVLEITNRTLLSIDLGIYKKPKFNLKLEAGITNITVKTIKGTTQTDYNMSNLAKAEIKSKEIKGATVLVEYTLKIINNGDIAGSVTQIVANKPTGLIFNSNLNQHWYEGNDTKIYLSGISDKIIKPGESANVKLILTKQMTENNVGKIENEFIITKTYNHKGLVDSNSNDNTAVVTCLLTVSTGMAQMYTGTAIILLVIIGIGVYVIRKKLSTEKRWI